MVEGLGPRQKAEQFIALKRMNAIRSPEDINLPEDLLRQRLQRMLIKNLTGNEYLDQMESLLKDAPISDFFKKQLIFDIGLEEAIGLPNWGEAQEKFLKYSLGISLPENEYGIFDPKLALEIEANYYIESLPLLEAREQAGHYNPVSYREWGQDIIRRIDEKNGSL